MAKRTPYGMKCIRFLLLMALLVTAIGCNEGQSLSGTVTVDGAPLPAGRIGFTPVEGTDKRVGTEIENGDYSLDGLAPGKYQVFVTGTSGEPPVPKSREEAQQAAAAAPKDLVTLDHPKNGQEVQISESTSRMDFEY